MPAGGVGALLPKALARAASPPAASATPIGTCPHGLLHYADEEPAAKQGAKGKRVKAGGTGEGKAKGKAGSKGGGSKAPAAAVFVHQAGPSLSAGEVVWRLNYQEFNRRCGKGQLWD